MIKITDITWSDAFYGCLLCNVDGRRAFIPTDKGWFVKLGYVLFIFLDDEDDNGILPTVTIPEDGERPAYTFKNCVKDKRLVKLWRECKKALNDGTFREGKVVADLIELSL